MTKHRSHHHKTLSSQQHDNNSNSNSNSNSAFNLGNIAQLLNSIDINQVSSLLGTMNNNTERQDNDVQQSNKENVGNFNGFNSTKNTSREDILRAINTLMNSDKSELLRVVMEVYSASKANNDK